MFLDNEQENAQRIIDFWQKYRRKILFFTAICFLATGITSYWHYESKQRAHAAFDHYTSFEQSLERDDKASISRTATLLRDSFSSSPYTSLAIMRLAHVQFDNDEYELAHDNLSWLIHHGFSEEIQVLAKIKLAELHLVTRNFEQSLTIINNLDKQGVGAIVNEMKGDLFVRQELWQKAIDSYIEVAKDKNLADSTKGILMSKVNSVYEKKR